MARYTPEAARDVLARNTWLEGRMRGYWQAIIDGTLPQHYLSEFLSKKNDYSDELPAVDVRTLPETRGERPTVYKCQANYLTGLGVGLISAVKDGVIVDENVIAAIELYRSSDLAFAVGDPNNQERLDIVNATLDLVIDHLQAN
jgi:hypothetical protein